MPSDPHLTRSDRTTIEDVASAAGVSVATVSRALRDLPNVAKSTRERVRLTAERLSYRPDPAASRLATGRSQAIAVAVPQLNHWYFSNVVAGVEAVCAESGYDTIVIGLTGRGAGHGIVDGCDALHRRADGLIVVDIALRQRDVDELRSLGLHFVSVGSFHAATPSTGIDDVAVGELATEFLIGLGHRRIGLIGGTTVDPYRFAVPTLRRQGFESAHARAGLVRDRAVEAVGDFTVQGGYDAACELLGSDNPPTAIFAQSDEMAFGVLHAARDLGLSVPTELSVIGVDDHEVSAAMGLTTIAQNVSEHGARAGRLVIGQINGDAIDPVRHNDPVTLIERVSTGPA